MPASVSVVIPCYRSEGSIGPLVERLLPVLRACTRAFEIVCVHDAGPDGTWRVIEQLAARYPQVRGIDLMKNYGQHGALLCGIRAARHDVIVTLDDDLQHPPEEIPRLLERLTDDVDVVYGTPLAEPHGLWRGLASRITKLALQAAMGAETARHASAFRAFRTRLRDAFADYRGSFVSIDVLLTWGSTRFTHVAVRHDPRTIGTSSYTLRKLLTHAGNMITGFSTLPLQIASILGFALTAFGVLLLAYVLGRWVYEGFTSVPGFPFLASAITIFSGAQLFCLGIIGEYLARMHFRMMERPPYAVRALTSAASPAAESRSSEDPPACSSPALTASSRPTS